MPKCFSVRASLLSGAAILTTVLPLAVSATVATVALSSPAYATGGVGGSVTNGTGAGGAGGVSDDGEAGGVGVAANTASSGGGGGGAGGGAGGKGGGDTGAGTGGAGGTATSVDGAAGGDGTGKGGGGGGGGGYNGNGAGAASVTNAGAIAGGNGGAGGNGSSSASTGGGGGGAGGYGVLITGSGSVDTNSGSITGGNGGAGGSGYGTNDLGGTGGDGGIGISVQETGATLTNTGTIAGGNGGALGTGQNSGTNGNAGAGGIGISGFDLTIVNAGTISGGMSGATTPIQADAIDFTDGINSLTLDPGSTISGDVIAFSASDTLALGGSGTASFDTTGIGVLGSTTAQYQGFGIFEKTGTSDWTLTGTTAVVTSWQILGGTLSIASDTYLGASTGTVTLNGGTLQFTANVLSARAFTIAGGNGTIDNDGNAVTLTGVLSGAGALTSAGSGSLILTGANTYTGGTIISAGTLQIGNGGTTGAITGPVTDNAALVFDVDGATSETGIISGTGSLTQEGTGGVLTLTGTNTFSGGTTVTGGLINFDAVSNFGAAAAPNVTLNGGGLQWATGTTTDISSDLNAIGSGGATFDTNGNNVSFATALTGAGGVTKAGAGVLTFSVANTYAGGTTVTGGLIDFSSLADFGAAPSITLNGGGLQWASGNTLDISSKLAAIGANGGTFDTNGNNVMLATAMTGTGGITKAGAGTLTLTATETYTGATVVSAGTLQIGDGGADGALAGDLVDNATVVFDRPDSVIFAGAISGTGSLVWDGPGTLTLTGDNSFTGTTTIDGPLVIDASGSSAVAGNISGTGSLTQAGAGVLILRGTNTYTGGTIATNGLINFNAVSNFGSAAAPNVTLNGGGLQWATGTTTDISSDLDPIGANGGAFDTNGNNVSFATALTGTGGVTKAGAGVLTFIVANSYSGGTTVTGGLIDFSSLANFGTTPAITLNGGGLQWASGNTLDISSHLAALGADGGAFDTNGNAVTLASVLSGAGGVTKLGAGTLTLSPAETYTGATLVSGGTLLVNGSIAASSGVTVSSGGTLGGSGTVSTLAVATGGTVAPGAGGGTTTLTVSGTAKFASGSTYLVNISGAASDKLAISGAASLGDAALVVKPAGSFALGQQYTVLTAAGGLGGTTFGSVAASSSIGTLANGAQLVPVATYDANDVYVTIDVSTISPFLLAGASANEKNVAAALDSVMTNNDGAIATFAPLAGLSSAGLQAALAGFSGEVAASAQDQAIEAARGFLDTLANAAAVGNAPSVQTASRGAVQLADNGSTAGLLAAPADNSSGFNVWGSLHGASNDTSANAKLGTHSTNADEYGGVIGMGYRDPDDRATIGMALGYSDIDWSLADTLGKGRAIAYQGGVYGSVMYRQAYISAQATIASYAVTTTRTVNFNGANVYQGKVISNDDGVHLELGRHFLTDEGWFTPYLSGALQQLDTPGYAETTLSGSSTYVLGYASNAHTDLTTELGAAYDSAFGSDVDDLFALHARLGWLHDYSAGIRDSATFAGFVSPSFTVYGASPSKDAAHVTLGVEQDLDGFAFTLDAQGLLGKSGHSIGGDAGIAYRM